MAVRASRTVCRRSWSDARIVCESCFWLRMNQDVNVSRVHTTEYIGYRLLDVEVGHCVDLRGRALLDHDAENAAAVVSDDV